MKKIKDNAIPFITLLYMPGHIGLYLGEKQDQIIMFHNKWGVKTKDKTTGKQGRVIIGRAVITSLEIAKNDDTVPQTWLEKLTKITTPG